MRYQNARFIALTVFIVVLTSSCLPTSTPAPQETSTSTATQRPTEVPTPTSTITPTPAPTPTPEPSIIAGDWAIDKATGLFDPSIMYLLVGSINHVDRTHVDLEYNDLRIAFGTSEDITQLENLDKFKNDQAKNLNKRVELKKKLDNIMSRRNPKLYTAVIENNEITQIVFQNGSSFKRYHVNEEGSLLSYAKEKEPQLLPELRVSGPYILRADTGEKIQFVGVGLYAPSRDVSQSILEYVQEHVERNREYGIYSNVIRVSLDILEVDEDIESIVDTVHYLEKQGIYIILQMHTIGDGNEGLPTDQVTYALDLLSLSLSSRRNVLYNLWNEVGSNPNGVLYTWSNWTPWIIKLSDAVYKNHTGEYRPIIIVGGIRWSSDFRNADIPISNYAIDVHQYDTVLWKNMVGNVPVLITENGVTPFEDNSYSEKNISYIRDSQRYVAEHPLVMHYLVWRGEPSGDGIFDYNLNLTPKGELIRDSVLMKRMTDFTR